MRTWPLPAQNRSGDLIPLRLSLRNFLCYREDVPTLDFAGIHLACLCGPNGHGKSALLDAITWCLWGRARSKTHDELISYGADESRVELDFMVRETPYRAVRTHDRGGGRRRQGVTELQLQVLSSGDPQPITENNIRETQAKIDQIVGMEYETFINSAFLLQGRADEFTNKIPSERKAVLTKILGLELYDRLQDRAKGCLSENLDKVRELDGALGEMRRQIDQIGDPTEELAAIDEEMASIDQRLDQRRSETDQLRSKVAELERQLGQLEELGQHIQTLRQELQDLESAANMGRARTEQYRELISQAETIRQGADRLEQARHSFEALEDARRAYDDLAQAKAELVRTIDNSRSRLEAQVEQLRLKVEVELPAKAQGETDLIDQQERSSSRLKGLEDEVGKIALHREQHRNLSTRVGEAQSVAERYKSEGQELRTKLDLLRSTDQREAVCPLCQTPLGEDGCGRLAETYESEIADKRRLYRLNANQLKQLEAERDGLERELSRRETTVGQERKDEEVKLIDLERKIKESRLAQEELKQADTQLSSFHASLASGDFAPAEVANLREIDKKIEALGYDDAARQLAYPQLQDLQPFAEKLRQLTDAESGLPREEESAAQAEEMRQRRLNEVERLEERQRTDQQAIADLPHWRAALMEAEDTQRTLDRKRQEAVGRRGGLEFQTQRLQSLKGEVGNSSARLFDLQEDQGVYQELVTAFGRQGIQAMLIEAVVPRLEEEANGLLGRMTDNRMNVRLETQRERRTGSGEPIETLEIQVSDELGPRSYEMYSGGEAFRVNLALRIALSKVLAQRMGAPLPTLFIDEGFGTQDASGRERILDVIAAIQDDFDKIIVITHLDDLKDVFPVRIEVQKGEHGSTFWLS